jgi:hypothetical protein
MDWSGIVTNISNPFIKPEKKADSHLMRMMPILLNLGKKPE